MTLAAVGVSVRAGGATLLSDIHLSVAPGELVVLAGPNGAGKSTLLRVLSGGVPAESGSVTLDGVAVRQARDRARRVAVMTAGPDPAFAWTAADLVLLGRTPHHRGAPGARDHSVVGQALEAVDATHLAGRRMPTLSSGERQRVQVARALAQIWQDEPAAPRTDADPPTTPRTAADGDEHGRPLPPGRYLLLDEPTANLDLRHQVSVLGLLRRVAASGVGVLAVLHDLNLAASRADRLVLLDAGRVAADGPPEAVLDPVLLARVFGLPLVRVPHPAFRVPLVVPDPGASQA